MILDNLEYDEEEKKAKLEVIADISCLQMITILKEINEKESKPDTVPFHLRIFKRYTTL